jgi:hypothetical protein
MEMKKKNKNGKRGVGWKKGDAVSCPQVPVISIIKLKKSLYKNEFNSSFYLLSNFEIKIIMF